MRHDAMVLKCLVRSHEGQLVTLGGALAQLHGDVAVSVAA
jgi:hypothetical protein